MHLHACTHVDRSFYNGGGDAQVGGIDRYHFFYYYHRHFMLGCLRVRDVQGVAANTYIVIIYPLLVMTVVDIMCCCPNTIIQTRMHTYRPPFMRKRISANEGDAQDGGIDRYHFFYYYHRHFHVGLFGG